MKRILPLLLTTLVLASCGTSGFEPTAEQAALAECLGISIEDFGEIYGEILDLMDSIGGVIPPGDTYDIATGNYTIALSLGTITGNVAPAVGTNLIDGLGVGEQATATWALNGGLAGAPVAVTGEGTITVARPSANIFNTSGAGGILDGDCDFDFSNFNFTTNTTTGAGPVGTLVYTVTAPEGTINGTITFNGTTTARVAATLDGEAFTFYIDLVTFEITY